MTKRQTIYIRQYILLGSHPVYAARAAQVMRKKKRLEARVLMVG
jgi:hypothetical protein